MKLTDDQQAAVKAAFGAEPIPDEEPALEELKGAFGEHTFYLDPQGLLIFEPDPDAEGAARAVLIARWTSEERQALGAVEPQATNAVINLDADAAAGGDGAPGAA